MEMDKKKPTLRMMKIASFAQRNLKNVLNIFRKIVLILLYCIPYYCTEQVHERIIKHIFFLVSVRLRQLPIDTILPSWIYFSTISLVKHHFYYMLQFHLPVLITVIFINYVTAMIHNEEEKRLMKLRELFLKLIAISKWKDSLINFICTSFISFASYVALTNWLASGLIIALDLKVFYCVMYVLGSIAGFVKWMEFNAVWNLGAAMSKEKHNVVEQILKISSFLAPVKARSTRVLGYFIMFLQFVWCFMTSTSTLIKGEDDLKVAIYSGIIDAGLCALLVWGKVI